MSQGGSVSILKTLASLEVLFLLGVSRASSKESKSTCLVPDSSQWWTLCKKCNMHVSRKLRINFEVSNLLRRIRSLGCLQSVLQEVLKRHAWFLTAVNCEFHVINVVCLSQGSSVSIWKSLTCLEGLCLLGVTRPSSKESKRTRFLMTNLDETQGSFRSIQKLPIAQVSENCVQKWGF